MCIHFSKKQEYLEMDVILGRCFELCKNNEAIDICVVWSAEAAILERIRRRMPVRRELFSPTERIEIATSDIDGCVV